ACAGCRTEADINVILMGENSRWFLTEINFVADQCDPVGIFQLINEGGPQFSRGGQWVSPTVNHEQDAVSLLDFLPGTLNPDLFYFVGTLAQSGCIDNMQRHAIKMDMLPQHIPSGTFDAGHNGAVAATECIEQAGLSRIGATGNHYTHAFTYQNSLSRFLKYPV